MKTKNHRLLSLATVLLALLLAIGTAPLLPTAQVLAAPGYAQGVFASNLPLETCTLAGTTRTCELWATTGTLTMPGGTPIPVWGFNNTGTPGAAEVPGPVIVANAGETLVVTLHNDLAGETVSLNFPGQPGITPDLAGVAAGATATYSFTLAAPGTFLYEAGMTPNGSRQVAMGMYGALVVRPAGAPFQAYNDPATTFQDEALLVLGAIDPLFNADPNNYDVQFYNPQYWLINGQAYPNTLEIGTVAGNTLLLRYLNATERTHGMGALGLRQLVIGSDGYPIDPPYRVVNETIAAGQSMDMLVSVPTGTTVGTKFALYNTSLMNHNASARAANGNLAFGGMMTFINTITGVPIVEAGPLTSRVAMIPNPTTGSSGVFITATVSDVTTGNRNVTRVEYYIDTLGAPGSGINMPRNRTAPTVNARRFIPATELAALAGGYHVFYVRGRDAAGYWGAPGAVILNLDKVGPDTTGLNLSKDPTNGTVPVTLFGTADDRWNGRQNIMAARYTLAGVTTPMTPNRTDLAIVEVSAVIPSSVLAGLAEGLYPIAVESQDALGNWGTPAVITMTLDKTGPEAPVVTLTPSTLDMTVPPSVTSVRVDAVITDTMSLLANAEAFIDAVGPTGEGFDLFPSDGVFDETSESAYFNMPLAHFSMLPAGIHTVTVHALDIAGNWGVFGQAELCIDRGEGCAVTLPPAPPPPPSLLQDSMGPTINELVSSPGATPGTIVLTASAVDELSNVAAAEYFIIRDPGMGLGQPMLAADSTFESLTEGLTATIDLSRYPAGTAVRIYVRALDTAGNWGSPIFIRVIVP